MLKSLFIIPICLFSLPYQTYPLNTELKVLKTVLSPNEPLHLHNDKNINKKLIQHIMLMGCKGDIDSATFKDYPKLERLTIWSSDIQKINTVLPITSMVVLGSHLPRLDANFQQNFPKLTALVMLGNKHYEVDVSALRNFKNLEALYVSEANFTKDCVTKDWFAGMKLKELGLSDNEIECIDDDAFDNLRDLKKLDLTYNDFEYVTTKMFKSLTKLENLGLYENPLTFMKLDALASQKDHLQMLGISWYVLDNSNISAEDFLKALPNLKTFSFGRTDMRNNRKATEFCRKLRQKGVNCEIDMYVFALSKQLGFSMLGSSICKHMKP